MTLNVILRQNLCKITFYGKLSVRQTCPTANSPTANCPYGELSVRQTVRTAKCPYGEMAYSELVYGELVYGESSAHGPGQTFQAAKLLGTSFQKAPRAFWVEARKGFGVHWCTRTIECRCSCGHHDAREGICIQ